MLFKEVKLMSSVMDRRTMMGIFELWEKLSNEPEDNYVEIQVGVLKSMMEVIKDYQTITQVSLETDPLHTAAATIDLLVNKRVDQIYRPQITRSYSVGEGSHISIIEKSGSDESIAQSIGRVSRGGIDSKVQIAYTVNPLSQHTFYKTAQLAEVFNVSVTAINKWIKEGRFLDYKRPQAGIHARIPADGRFLKSDGSIVYLQQLVKQYNGKKRTFADDEERLELMEQIHQLQQKYGKLSCEDTFSDRPLTPAEESDKSWWTFYERKLEELNDG
ncbi:hypothetical protein SAMN04487969_12620 [Paenibacillus algorifonticola]|uniref:Uncharacterized protein n=1 Tax=Paenibacillus algorifonticola TaxID=684063 RepID=A0A1I2HRG3_9BACL|nr:helix-turn-helix domain-containing protein [Paenibacillus algorifonticola]SFF32479.1 hypothetical protein SAMN04487969_12620 [Paenibacillus algorifonticola]